MPFEIKIHPGKGIGVIQVAGDVDTNTILDVFDALVTSDRWTPGFDMLWNCRAVESLVVAPSETDAIVRRLTELDPRIGRGRSAIVVERDIDRCFAQLMMCKKQDSGRERRLFDSAGLALRWLEGQDAPPEARTSEARTSEEKNLQGYSPPG